MNTITQQNPRFSTSLALFFKNLSLYLAVGVILGLIGTAFHLLLDATAHFRESYLWSLWLLPLAGVAIAALYQFSHMQSCLGTNSVLMAVRGECLLKFRMAPLIFVSTVLTHLFGGSSGCEGAALQLGGSVANALSRWLKLSEHDVKVLTICGMSAGFTALFGTPVAAAVFAVEVVTVGLFNSLVLAPAAISAFTAYYITHLFGIKATHFGIPAFPTATPTLFLKIAVLGLGCAAMGVLFCKAMEKTSVFFRTHFKNPMLRAFFGGCLIVAFTLLSGSRDFNGTGTHIIAAAIAGSALWFAPLLKILFTAVTLSSGFKGGEIVPSFFVGATFGCFAAPFLALEPGFAAALGMTAVFCAVTNAPIASIFIATELFGSQGLFFYFVICAVTFSVSGRSGLYAAQKFLFEQPANICLDITKKYSGIFSRNMS